MIIKFLEIRDRATFIPAMAVQIMGGDSWMLRRFGFDNYIKYIFLIRLDTLIGHLNEFEWDNRTMSVAHKYIIAMWYEINNEDVIDVEYILGESSVKKISERS